MPKKYFEKFSDLIEWRKNCPVCNKPLVYEVKTSTGSTIGNGNVLVKLTKHFDSMLGKHLPWGTPKEPDAGEEEKTIVAQFQPAVNSEVDIKELNLFVKFDKNVCYVDDIESATFLYDLKIHCPHDVLGDEYNAIGSFDVNADYADESLIPRENGKYCLSIDNVSINYEQYKVCNVHLEDEKPNGNFIKIINDYNISKTSFSIAEVNLDGTFGTWKERRMELVHDSFFRFHDSEKVFSRINTIFLLADK